MHLSLIRSASLNPSRLSRCASHNIRRVFLMVMCFCLVVLLRVVGLVFLVVCFSPVSLIRLLSSSVIV